MLDEQIAILDEQKKKQEQLKQEYKSMLGVYTVDLQGFGINFDSKGDITNLDEILNKHIDSANYEKLKKLVDEYLEIQRDKLPDVEKEWESLNSQIKDVYREQLEVVKDIEDEITAVYKRQVKDRIDLINKELDERLEALDKQKKAYKDARDEADYQKDYDKQLKKVTDLQTEIDKVSKDTSLSGQKKLQELLEQLAEEQENLENLVQDKIDSDIEDMFDAESDRLTDSAENAIEDLEDKFSDSKIAELVAQALGSGVFTDIEGNVSSLEDALIDFAEESGELFGVLGSVIEQELIGKLEEAIGAFEDLDNILDQLGVDSRSIFTFPNVDYNSSRYIPSHSNNVSNTTNNQVVEVNFNEPLLVVQGNVDKQIMPNMDKWIREAEKKITYNIVKNIKS